MNEDMFRAGRYLGFIMALFLFIALFPLNCDAAELLESEVSDVISVSQGDSALEHVFEFPESIGTYALNEDEYNSPDVGTYALNNSVYSGSYNSTILSIWNGLIQNNVGKDYVAYRADQYTYYIFFGEDFVYNSGRFSGSGTYYRLNTQLNAYSFVVGSDSFSVNVNGSYLYTNVTGDFPTLDNDRGLIYEQIQTIVLIALLAFSVLRWIFINR